MACEHCGKKPDELQVPVMFTQAGPPPFELCLACYKEGYKDDPDQPEGMDREQNIGHASADAVRGRAGRRAAR